jgi:hypothetical protein
MVALADKASGYVTGFCGVGAHEGVELKSPSGAVLRSCTMGGRYDANLKSGMIVCTCSCHDMSREMEQLTGQTLPPVLTNRTPPRLGSLLGLPGRSTGGLNEPGTDDMTTASVAVASGARFAVTPTGRAARGQLEEQVRYVIEERVKAAGHDLIALVGLTTGAIMLAIDRDNPPSSGAVYSVLKRWSGANLIDIAESPYRFLRYTDRGKRELFRG